MEFWKKENGDRFIINGPILSQRYSLKIGHHPYLTHLNVGHCKLGNWKYEIQLR